MTYDVYAQELAAQILANTEPSTVYAIPMDIRAAEEAHHYALDFHLHQRKDFKYLVVDETTLAQTLTEATKEASTLKLVRWTQDKHREADEKEMVDYLLARAEANLAEVETYPVYQIETYTLLPDKNGANFAFPEITEPISVTLDGLIQVRRAEVALEDDRVTVSVVYAPIASIKVDYKASVRLLGPEGQVVMQNDRILRHNWHQPTSLWPREEVNEYYVLPLPPASAAGNYTIQLVIYDPETLAPLTDNGVPTVNLGTIPYEHPDIIKN